MIALRNENGTFKKGGQAGSGNFNYKHGMRKTRLFNIWSTMIQRCENKNKNDFRYYGGRGIKVCTAWHEAGAFIKWALAHGYHADLTLDRKDNDGDYTPKNCRWTTRAEQALNRSPKGTR